MAVVRFSEKPVVVDAVEYTGTNAADMMDFCPYLIQQDEKLFLFGLTEILPGMWVLKDQAEIYSAFADNFLDYYRPGGGP